MDIKLPDCLTTGKATREVSWFALLVHIRTKVAQDGPRARVDLKGQEDDHVPPESGSSPRTTLARATASDLASPPTQVVYSHNDDQPSGLSDGIQDLACIERHWATIRSRLRGRGIQSPRQLLSGRSMAQAVWILPTQLSGNPGWLRPLRRLLSRVDVPTLFHALDRSEGAPEPPAHQELIPPLLLALQKPTSQQQLSAIFTDDRWLQIRSSAPLQSWINALQREGIEPPMENEDHRRKVAVDMLRTIGASLTDLPKLRRLCVWLAPSLYTVRAPDAQGDAAFSPIEPLSRRYVSLITDAGAVDNRIAQVGIWTLTTKGGVITIREGARKHIGTVNQGRWRMLAAEQDQADLIRSLPGWITQVEEEERSRGVPSHQLWRGIGRAFHADVIVGCNPLVAPACFRSALCGRAGSGWGHQEVKTRKVFNLLCLPSDIMLTIVTRLRPDAPWLALTREKSLTKEVEAHLQQVGTRVYVWRKGAIVAASTGAWRKAQVRSVQSKETWTLWANAQTAGPAARELRDALKAISLTRDGTVPLDSTCPAFREATLGPAGSYLTHAGVVVATDGSVKDDGRMGAAYVALDNRLPPRSFVVLGPPSSMRGELSGIDAAVADAPGEEDLTILTDSLTSIQKLASMQRQDFPERLNGHPEKVLLESLVRRINERARAQVFTRIVKCPAHKAHPLNEAADAAASRAAEEGDVETAALSHADSKAVRFCLRGRLTEWGAGVRRALAQVETSHYQALLTERLTRQATSDEPGADLPDDRRGGRAVSLTAQWLLRPEQGRQYLGAAMAEMRHGAAKRRVMQTVAGLFPCQALLHRWGKAPSPQCLLCSGDTESVAHIQCWCPALKEARIAAHHAIAAHIMQMLQAHNVARWQFHQELAVSSLRAIEVPLDMHDTWHRMVDELDEMEMDDDDLTGALARLRPDAWAISWGKRQVLILELTRAHDWRQDWVSTTDTFKVQRYARLQTRMQALLPWGWVVETVPLTIGVRGSIHEPTWRRILDRFGIETRDTQERFFHDLTRQALEELDRMYGVRSEALRQLHAGPDARRS